MAGTTMTKEAFDAALRDSAAIPQDPVMGDGRQYYTGNENGKAVVFMEDKTGSETRYFKAPGSILG